MFGRENLISKLNKDIQLKHILEKSKEVQRKIAILLRLILDVL